MTKRLYRSKEDKIISGVCGGIAEYFGVDPSIVRIACALLVFFPGIGFIAYITAWLVIPYNPKQKNTEDTFAEKIINDIFSKKKSKSETSKTQKTKDYKKSIDVQSNKIKETIRPYRTRLFVGIILIIIGGILLLENAFPNIRFGWVWNLWPVVLIIIGLKIILQNKKHKSK